MLMADSLRKVYITREKKMFGGKKREVEAVKNLTLRLEPGEIVGLLGMNGAGKTTTIKMLSTLLIPTSGTVTIDGFDSVKDPKRIKGMVNMIAGGERMLYWRLTGWENLEYFGNLYGLSGKKLKDRIHWLLKQVGLEEAADTPVERYSKGMKQRLQIARGLINDPKYIFLDEPTLGLDAPVAKHLREYVSELARQEGKGIILTSHYLAEVEELCNRVYVIEKGELIIHDTPSNLILNIADGNTLSILIPELPDAVHRELISLVQPLSARLSSTVQEDGVELLIKSKQDITSLVVQFLSQSEIPLLKLSIERPRLEDAILKLARRETA